MPEKKLWILKSFYGAKFEKHKDNSCMPEYVHIYISWVVISNPDGLALHKVVMLKYAQSTIIAKSKNAHKNIPLIFSQYQDISLPQMCHFHFL